MTREEAINEIESWAFLNKKMRGVLEVLIPELHDVNDNWIKERLLECCDDPIFSIYTGINSEILKDWLKKQEQPESIPVSTFSDAYHLLTTEGYVVLERKDYEELMDMLENHRK